MRDRREYQSIRVIDVSELGEDALVVHAGSMTLLLIDADLPREDRMDIMAQLMGSEVKAS